MATKDTAKVKGLRGTEAQAKTRLLLALWDIGGAKAEIKKKDLTDRALLNNERVGDYTGILEQLTEAGAIAVKTEKRVAHISLTDKGLQALDAGLKSTDFKFDGNQVKAKDVDALLKWFREMGTLNGAATAPAVQGKAKEGAIESYDKFKQVALDVYDQLNRDYNLDNLVPIYRIRREIGERVTRSHFNEWLLEMQASDIFQLIGGEMPDISPDKAEDSINTKLGAVRYYAKRLNSQN